METLFQSVTLNSAVSPLCLMFAFSSLLNAANDVKENNSSRVIFYPKNTLSDAGRRKAAAFADYAVGYIRIRQKGKFTDASTGHLLAAVKGDPYAIHPLKLLFAKWTRDKNYKELLEHLRPLAEKYPDALRLNLIVANAMLHTGQKEKAAELLAESLKKTGFEPGDKVDTALITETLTELSGIYLRLKKVDEGEELWDEALEHKKISEQLLVRIAAAVFYSRFADQGPDGFFAGWSKRRYRGKLEENLNAVELLWEKHGITNALLLAPVLKIYKRYSMPDRAEKILLGMLLSNPFNSSAMLVLAQTYSDFRRYADALRAWQMIIDSGYYQKAGRLWKFLTRGRGGEGDFYLELAIVALRGGNLKEAVRAFDWFLLLNPDDPEALFQLGVTYMRMQNFTTAILKFERISVLPEADFYRARCYANERRYEKALEALDDAEKTAEKYKRTSFLDESFYIEYAFVADQAGEFKKAESTLKKLLKKSPDNPMLNNFLGYLWTDHGVNLDKAEKLIYKALSKDSDNPAYVDSMAWVFFRKKRYDDALDYIEKALELEGEIPDAVIADHAGDIYFSLGDEKSALRYWRIAVNVYSEDIDRKKVYDKIDNIRDSGFDKL